MSDERLAGLRERYAADPVVLGIIAGVAKLRAEVEVADDAARQNYALVEELQAEVEALRAPAQLGSALVEALRGSTNPLHIMADGRVWKGSASQITTDATRHLASLLSALPVVEDAADHREKER